MLSIASQYTSQPLAYPRPLEFLIATFKLAGVMPLIPMFASIIAMEVITQPP